MQLNVQCTIEIRGALHPGFCISAVMTYTRHTAGVSQLFFLTKVMIDASDAAAVSRSRVHCHV